MHRLTATQQSATATPAAAPTLRASVLAAGMLGGITSTVDGEALPDTDVVEVPPQSDALAVTEAAVEPVGRGEALPVDRPGRKVVLDDLVSRSSPHQGTAG